MTLGGKKGTNAARDKKKVQGLARGGALVNERVAADGCQKLARAPKYWCRAMMEDRARKTSEDACQAQARTPKT